MDLFNVYKRWDIEPVRGSGSKLWDAAGQEYLDLYGGHAVISIGHSHPHYVKAISEQIARLGFYSNAVQNGLQDTLAQKLGAISGYPGYHLFLCNSGAEANENALKLASFHTGRSRVLAFSGAFHGRTGGAVSVTDNPKIRSPFNATDKVTFVPLGDLEAAQKELATRAYAAVIIATGGKSYPVTGSTGDGYRFAQEAGHTVTAVFPSETALLPRGYDPGLPGLEMKNVGLQLYIDRALVESEQGDFNFTDDGLESGIAYHLSRRAVWALCNGQKVDIILDLKPALTLEKLEARIARESASAPRPSRLDPDSLRSFLPKPLVAPFRRANPDLSFDNLAKRLKSWSFPIVDYKGFERAVVTAGGVSLKEVVPKTMASRLRPGLFFCGEVLDLDGDTGGYNLQIAFSTGSLAGISAANYLLRSV